MHLLAGSSARRILLLMLLASGAGSSAWCQFSNAYSSVPQHVQDQDAALREARDTKEDVDGCQSALAMPDMLQAANPPGDAASMRNLGCVYWDGLLAHDADRGQGSAMVRTRSGRRGQYRGDLDDRTTTMRRGP